MTDTVRRFVAGLSARGVSRFLAHAGLSLPDIEHMRRHQRTNALLGVVLDASDDVRGRLEGIAGHIMALVDKGHHAELALRAVSEDRNELIAFLEADCSLQERVMNVSFEEPRLLDRARNLAMTFAWRDGRYHAGFTVGNPQEVNENIDDAIEAIRSLVQTRQGGRKVYTEAFTYTDPLRAEVSKHEVPIHHIAIYLEAPASVLMEFQPGHPAVSPVVRREAKEMAIEYSPATGTLDLVGKGVGGIKVFRDVANEFRARALADATLTELKHEEWPLDSFLHNQPPKLAPPPGFSSVRVTGLLLRSQRQHGGRAEFRAGTHGTAYDRMRELGVINAATFEWASEVTLTLVTVPSSEDESGREVRVTLKWPNGLAFEGAGVKDRRQIQTWLRGPAFQGLTPPK